MKNLQEQFTDATGRFGEYARNEGVLYEQELRVLQTPHFLDITKTLQLEIPGQTISLRANQLEGLQQLPHTRVMVGIKTAKGAAFLPSVVLPDSQKYGLRFGSLHAPEDVRKSTMDVAVRPLTDFQQLLLAKIAAEHLPDTGKHGEGGRMNGGEIGHAVVALALPDPANIHRKVHSLVDSTSLSATLASSGVTDMIVAGKPRVNRELILTPRQVAGVVITEAHQVPFPIQDAFDVSAGFTYVAQETQGKKLNLARNLSGMAAA